MKNSDLTWLHISDIHFHERTEWRDSTIQDDLLSHLKQSFRDDPQMIPDLIFFTGDVAFGELNKSHPLGKQYERAGEFINSLREVCSHDGKSPLDMNRVYVVPGNHDVNRASINADAQTTLQNKSKESGSYIEEINNRFSKKTQEFEDCIKRLSEYNDFTKAFLEHQYDEDGRVTYNRIVEVNGLKVGICGFNSAWTCAGDSDDRMLWAAGEVQLNRARTVLNEADIKICLTHHPIDWFNAAEREFLEKRIPTSFDFFLHGHTHNAWVTPEHRIVKISAGAIGASRQEEFGCNVVQLDFQLGEGLIHLYDYSRSHGSWKANVIPGEAPNGKWHIHFPKNLSTKPELTLESELQLLEQPLHIEDDTQSPKDFFLNKENETESQSGLSVDAIASMRKNFTHPNETIKMFLSLSQKNQIKALANIGVYKSFKYSTDNIREAFQTIYSRGLVEDLQRELRKYSN